MQLSEKELKLVERLRKEDQRWHRARWFVLICGLLCVAFYFAVSFWLAHWLLTAHAGKETDLAAILFVVAFLLVKSQFIFAFGSFFFRSPSGIGTAMSLEFFC